MGNEAGKAHLGREGGREKGRLLNKLSGDISGIIVSRIQVLDSGEKARVDTVGRKFWEPQQVAETAGG